jgi:hypothetical protein
MVREASFYAAGKLAGREKEAFLLFYVIKCAFIPLQAKYRQGNASNICRKYENPLI